MRLETGIDMIEISRIANSIKREGFVPRVFSKEEQELFAARGWNVQTVAANFAAKEAFAKALGTGFRGFLLNEVSLLRDEQGKPYYSFSGAALAIVKQNNFTFAVSVTHTKEYAAAVAVCCAE